MSVHGELSRHLEGTIAALGESPEPAAARLRASLVAARPERPADVSASAEHILSALAEHGLVDPRSGEAPEVLSATAREAAGDLAALSRIVLGR